MTTVCFRLYALFILGATFELCTAGSGLDEQCWVYYYECCCSSMRSDRTSTSRLQVRVDLGSYYCVIEVRPEKYC